MDLKDRLEKIESLKKKVKQITNPGRDSRLSTWKKRKAIPISDVIEIIKVDTPYGPCLYREKKFPFNTPLGDYALEDLSCHLSRGLNSLVFNNSEIQDNIQLNQSLFFDTETTGLAGGAGTYIFLVGLGFFEANYFCIRQYFMSDYNEEEALLWAVNQLFAQDFKLLVTYNGKCYDFPLINTRFIMTRLPLNLPDPYHLDLLYSARRLWKKRLQDCSLGNIEKKVLNVNRGEDIPGYLIPHVYFRYLKSRDARPLKPIFEHNLQDVLSMVLLAGKIGQILNDPFQSGNKGIDLYSIGKIYEKNKEYEFSSRCYEMALQHDLSDEESFEVMEICSFSYKKQNKWDEAIRIWQDIINMKKEFIYYPYEELAKYYEHQLKDYSKAQIIVEEALTKLDKKYVSLENKEKFRKMLRYRLERIIRKQESTCVVKKDKIL